MEEEDVFWIESIYDSFYPFTKLERACKPLYKLKNSFQLNMDLVDSYRGKKKELAMSFLSYDYSKDILPKTLEEDSIYLDRIERFVPYGNIKNTHFEIIYNPCSTYHYVYSGDPVTYSLTKAVTGKRVRISSKHLGNGRSGYALQLFQFDVFGINSRGEKENVSRNKPVASPHSIEAYRERLTNGDYTTLCSSNFYDDEKTLVYFEIDLEGTHSISDFCLHFRTNSYVPKSFSIDIFDGISWINVVTQKDFSLRPKWSMHVKEGSFLIIPPMLRHELVIDNKDCLVFKIKFFGKKLWKLFGYDMDSSDLFSFLFKESMWDDPYIIHNSSSKSSLDLIFRLLLNEIFFGDNNSLVKAALLSSLLSFLVKEEKPTEKSGKALKHLNLANEVRSFINKNFRDTSVAEVAKHFNYSKEYLTRHIKENTGLSISQNILSAKINYAKQLLASGEYSVYETGLLSGFSSIAHFSRTFKKQVGKSPSEYLGRKE